MRYKAVEGGTQEVEAKPSELRFYDKHKGVYVSFHRSTSSSNMIFDITGVHTLHVSAHTALGQAGLETVAQPSLSHLAACENCSQQGERAEASSTKVFVQESNVS